MLKRPISRFVILAGVCGLALTPFFKWGSPSGHDFEFHLFSWMEVLAQWKQGVIYPRWAGQAHWGYGEARFVFYPPASWTLGAALGAMLPWGIVPYTYCWIVLTAAGASMYALARQWLRPADALFGAVFYAVNPYHLLIVYWRSAYAELLAGALLPLVVLCVTRLKEAAFRSTIWLSLVLACAWLINAPAALMIHYSAAGLAVLLAVRERSARLLIKTALAVLLGAGLASFYLVPAIYEEGWVNISQLLSPGVRPQDDFLFTTIADVDHNRFNMLVSVLALAEIVVLAFLMWLARRRRSDKSAWWLLSTWGAASAFVMLPASNLLWEHLPKFRYVQLPFRWLLCMNVSLAMLLAIATSQSFDGPSSTPRSATSRVQFIRWTVRVPVIAVLLAVIFVAGHRLQPPWWDASSDIALMSDAFSNGSGYEGTDEYVPAGADPYEIKPELPRVSDEAGRGVSAQMIEWNVREKHFVAHSRTPHKLTIRIFNYPAWEVTVNGKRVQAETTEVTGLMVIPAPAGDDDVRVRFGRTPDRTAGGIVSLISLSVFGVAWRKTRSPKITRADGMTPRTVLIATSNAGKLRDFSGAAGAYGIAIASIPGFSSLPPVVEDGATFEANARKKAEEYSRTVPGKIVLADDSGLEIDALGGEPGVHSARYAAEEPARAEGNTDDEANNARVLRELAGVPPEKRTGRFVCVVAAARDGVTLASFRGTAEGIILDAPRGKNGFGYDPLFYFPQIRKTFAELSAAEKAQHSHRGAAFRSFLEWYRSAGDAR